MRSFRSASRPLWFETISITTSGGLLYSQIKYDRPVLAHTSSGTCTSRLRKTSGTRGGWDTAENTPTLASARNGRPSSGPVHEVYRDSTRRRCCLAEKRLSTGVSSSVTKLSTLDKCSARISTHSGVFFRKEWREEAIPPPAQRHVSLCPCNASKAESTTRRMAAVA